VQKAVGSLGGVDTIPAFPFQYPQTDRRKSSNFVPPLTLPDINNSSTNIQKRSSDFAPGLSYQTAPTAPLNYGYGTRPAVTRPVQVDEEEETILPAPIPLPSRPVSGVRHRLRIVPLQDKPDNNQDEPAGNVSTESEELEERDAADELFIGREEEPPRDSAPEEVLIEDLDDTVAEVDLPVVSPSELSTNSRRASFAIWGEDEDADENLVQQGSEDASAMHLTVGLGTDPGIARKDAPNEDSLFAIQGMRITDQGSKPAGLFVIADGMGGHVNGREASRSAIHALTDVIVPTLLRDVSGNSAHEEETLFIDMLKDGVHRANLSLYRRNRDIQGMMGTTLTAALVVDTNAYIANVGDSRTYLYRADEGLRQITHDHSIVAQMVENGVITREDIYTHPRRNQIYRCLGEHASVEIDTFVVPLLPNDVLILCSDGLWEMVHDPDLEKIIASSAYSPGQLSTLLVQAALNNGGADNISVVVVRVADAAQNKNWLL
jgi:serine/threonine protein phosphatase PrpC